jgi:hypothetical protein
MGNFCSLVFKDTLEKIKYVDLVLLLPIHETENFNFINLFSVCTAPIGIPTTDMAIYFIEAWGKGKAK